MTVPLITKRLIFHFGGYDPIAPDAAHRRFIRELRRFEKTWSATASVSQAEVGPDEAAWDIVTTGPNWRVETRYISVRWDDVMEAYRRQPMWRRVPRALLAFLEFVTAGAFWGYLRTNWRYALFFLYPVFLFSAFIAVAWLLGSTLAKVSGSILAGSAIGFVVFSVLLRWPGRRLYLALLFDDWIFSSNYIRGATGPLDLRLDRIARQIAEAASRPQVDEILVSGHSLGVVLAIDTLDRALNLDPTLGLRQTPVALLSLGSSMLKIGLHRGAIRFRAAAKRVAAAPGILWAEYQAIIDVMNFYKVDPIAALGLTTTRRPVMRLVHIRDMLDPPAYRRIRRSFLRVHRQFISATSRRTSYDYFLLVCGPLSVGRHVNLPERIASALSLDGALLDRANEDENPPERAALAR